MTIEEKQAAKVLRDALKVCIQGAGYVKLKGFRQTLCNSVSITAVVDPLTHTPGCGLDYSIKWVGDPLPDLAGDAQNHLGSEGGLPSGQVILMNRLMLCNYKIAWDDRIEGIRKVLADDLREMEALCDPSVLIESYLYSVRNPRKPYYAPRPAWRGKPLDEG